MLSCNLCESPVFTHIAVDDTVLQKLTMELEKKIEQEVGDRPNSRRPKPVCCPIDRTIFLISLQVTSTGMRKRLLEAFGSKMCSVMKEVLLTRRLAVRSHTLIEIDP